ncbi:conserved hypothetical protein [Escherichia coli M605]|uniref:Uncharacterized protein n=1 Tax=Escherichia coli M605 TaxID=656417 RepID=F4SV44_ECOLX|nr:conserved hypothetical protein [Escherichia coli M605]EGI16868.1 conserved hypothetical protein [Escherichia coli M605]
MSGDVMGHIWGKKLAQEDKKSPCANALLQVTNTI